VSITSNLKKAILAKNWKIVHDLYEDLTGESAMDKPLKNKKTTKKKSKKKSSNKKNNNQVVTQTEKTGVGGRKTVLLTDEIPSEQHKTIEDEVRSNLKRAKNTKTVRGQRKTKKHKVMCNECENSFDSMIAANTIGQKCPKCLKQKIAGR